jgi:hypothetical protein
MSSLRYRMYRLYRTAIRKIQTALRGPKIHPHHVRAAHYFSDAWVLNFWQVMDHRKLNDDLRHIVSDGFNTIILVVPWREFQISQFKPAYDPFYIKQLDRVMAAADKHNLSVIVRVAYSHQISESATISGLTQAQRLLCDPDTHKVWLHYLATVFEICHGYRSFRYGFLSWEEFWHAFGRWQLDRDDYRIKTAKDTGFNEYLLEQGIEGVTAIPRSEEPEHEFYHAFINHRIAQMYDEARAVFPRLCMEVRVDKDTLYAANGEVQWLSNDNFDDHDNTRLTYWAPFMGAANQGEQLTAQRAVELLAHMLNDVSENGDKPNHIVDQFNFVDEAPKFKGIHAEINPAEVSGFLDGAAPLLAHNSAGYGVWAYRDYRQNLLYNARFLMGVRGWHHSSGPYKILRKGGVQLPQSAVVRQVLPVPVVGLQYAVPFDKFTLEVDVSHALLPGHCMSARINSATWLPLQVSENGKVLCVDIPIERSIVRGDGIVFELRNDGPTLKIYTLSLYHYVFRGSIRLESGEPSTHHAALVEFNTQLRKITERPADQTV